MSLPLFSTPQSLFGVGSLADNLFPTTNRFRLFAEKIWPRLVHARPELETMDCADNGRPAAEPVVLAGVCLLPFLERVPDRAAMELLTMHLGWEPSPRDGAGVCAKRRRSNRSRWASRRGNS